MSILVHVMDWNLKNSLRWKGDLPMSSTTSRNSCTFLSRAQLSQCRIALAMGVDSLNTSDHGSLAKKFATSVDPTRLLVNIQAFDFVMCWGGMIQCGAIYLSWKTNPLGGTTRPELSPAAWSLLTSCTSTLSFSRLLLDPKH